jgi:hypothetical protein
VQFLGLAEVLRVTKLTVRLSPKDAPYLLPIQSALKFPLLAHLSIEGSGVDATSTIQMTADVVSKLGGAVTGLQVNEGTVFEAVDDVICR